MALLKFVAYIAAAPLAFSLLVAIVGILFGVCGRRKIATALLSAGGVVAYLASTRLVGDGLLGSLEWRYPPIPEGWQAPPNVSWIVVLGSSYTPRNGIPVTAALDADGLVRIVEAVRLSRRLPMSHLLVSGGARLGRTPPALGYEKLATDLGVDPSLISISDTPLDTAGEARATRGLLADAPFLLVTSAYHMPRAMRLMRAAGTRPIPAPTGQLVNRSAQWGLEFLLPSSAGLRETERALHEYFGLLAMAVGAQ